MLGEGWLSPQAGSFRAAKVMAGSKVPSQLGNTEGVGGATSDSGDAEVDGLRHGCVG